MMSQSASFGGAARRGLDVESECQWFSAIVAWQSALLVLM